jgi:D-sedoheptulose 7-phosphate isomerase
MKTLHSARIYMASVMVGISHVDFVEIEKAIEILRVIRKNRNTAFIVGNGGSAATASHFANDLLKMCGIRALSIPDMTPTTLAYGNDNGWKYQFVDPISKLYNPGDALIAISCSGNSENVVNCTEFIKEPIIVLTGNNPKCKLAMRGAGAIIYTDSDDITIQESTHSAVCHVIARILSDEV